MNWFKSKEKPKELEEKNEDPKIHRISKLKIGEKVIKTCEITDEYLFIRIPIFVDQKSMTLEYYIPLEDLRKALIKED